MMTWLSKHVFFPLWDLKDRSDRRRYLSELSASQWSDLETIRTRQWGQLQALIAYAYEHVPYYRTRFAEAGLGGAVTSWSDFRRLPILHKRDIRENAPLLRSSEYRPEELVEARTGGSTGTSLTLYFDRKCQELRNAAARRSDRWAGWDIGM